MLKKPLMAKTHLLFQMMRLKYQMIPDFRIHFMATYMLQMIKMSKRFQADSPRAS